MTTQVPIDEPLQRLSDARLSNEHLRQLVAASVRRRRARRRQELTAFEKAIRRVERRCGVSQ